jgi:RNA-directed DNA polymerase
MNGTMILANMLPGRLRVAERAKKNPQEQIRSLAHHIDVDALRRAFHRIRKDAAVGVDGVTKEAYGANLEENLRDLHERLRTMRYRHQPIRRVYIPKEKGKQRPIGVSTIEDKLVQDALREVLEMLYEPQFLSCSYGFRPGRKAHDALRAIDRAVYRGEARFILEFDIQSFFDSVIRRMLSEMLQKRIADKSLMRLIGKCLHVGVLDGEQYTTPEDGTVQGSVLSPILGNIYLHHVLDLWFEQEVKPCMHGRAFFARYADDGVFGFELWDDAQRVMRVLARRLARFGLQLNLDKTRLVDFRRPWPNQPGGKGRATFDFLGFTLYWRRSGEGRWVMTCKTRRARLQRVKHNLNDWCRGHRHLSVREQYAALKRRIQGHFNYFGVRGNEQCLSLVIEYAKRIWIKWLNRRSQRRSYNWARFLEILKVFPLPTPVATISLWGATT